MLVALDSTLIRTPAWVASRKDRFTCPECSESVVLKRGEIKIAHYAHKPDSDCPVMRENGGKGESLLHVRMKMQAGELMQRLLRDMPVDYEVRFGVDRRADVVAGSIVIECQASDLSTSEWQDRTDFYNEQGYSVLWLWHVSRTESRNIAGIRHARTASGGRAFLLDDDGAPGYWAPNSSVHFENPLPYLLVFRGYDGHCLAGLSDGAVWRKGAWS